MEKYESAIFEEITELDVNSSSNENCGVVCSYMYGYCSESDGWGTTYCPEWGSSSDSDDGDDDDDYDDDDDDYDDDDDDE